MRVIVPKPRRRPAGAVPGADVAVIRSEKIVFLLDPLDATSLVRNAQRVLYRTTTRTGRGSTPYAPRSACPAPA